jgi:iron complex transport system substrate-binding protein
MKRYILLFAVLFAFVLNASAQKRIISLAPSLTKSIYQLGAGDQLVGFTSFCVNPTHNKVEVVASAVTVNLEKVISLQPDLVVASSLTNPETLKKLNQLGIKTAMFPYPNSFDEICSYFIEIGKLTGHEGKAREIVTQSQQELEEIRQQRQNTSKPSVFIEIGAKPLFGAACNTFLDDYITFAGGTNILKDQKQGSVTRESILLSNPDYIILSRMGGFTGDEEYKTWMNYNELKAAKNRHVYKITSEDMCSPTPSQFIEVLQEIIDLMDH